MLGVKWPTPIVINPVGSQKAFHPEGEIAVARAAKTKNHLQVLSTVATSSIENVIAARGAPVWFQLYHQEDWNQTKQMVKRAERAGAPAVVFTVDLIGGSNRETMVRSRKSRHANVHELSSGRRAAARRHGSRERAARQPAQAGDRGHSAGHADSRGRHADVGVRETPARRDDDEGVHQRHRHARRRRDRGGQRRERHVRVEPRRPRREQHARDDRQPAGGRRAGVRGRVPVILDGGIRRGTDIFKAWRSAPRRRASAGPTSGDSASFGQEGVETVLALLRKEIEMTMRQAGTQTVKGITQGVHRPPRHLELRVGGSGARQSASVRSPELVPY